MVNFIYSLVFGTVLFLVCNMPAVAAYYYAAKPDTFYAAKNSTKTGTERLVLVALAFIASIPVIAITAYLQQF